MCSCCKSSGSWFCYWALDGTLQSQPASEMAMGSCEQDTEVELTWSCSLHCLNWPQQSSVRACWVSLEHAVIISGVMLDALLYSLCVSHWALSVSLVLEWRVHGVLVCFNACFICLFLAESTSKRGTWSSGKLYVEIRAGAEFISMAWLPRPHPIEICSFYEKQ